jgi:ribonuclease P protein component
MPKFRKDEKLCSKKVIEEIFTVGHSFVVNSFKIILLQKSIQSNYPAKVLIVVSKKHFKNAVTRNLIKRKIREAYRLNKESLYQILKKNKLKIVLSISFNGREQIKFEEIEIAMKKIINRIEEKIKQNIISD